jgi:hypothetical protein
MRRALRLGLVLMVGCSVGSGGGNKAAPDSGSGDHGFDAGTVTDAQPLSAITDPLSPLLGFKTGAAQLAQLCARGNADAVSKAFCATSTPPTITSITDLQALVGLAFQAGNNDNGTGGNPAFVLTGHSTSLVTQFTTPINPRAIIFTPPNTRGRVGTPKPLASFVAMGFVRGEQFVELVSNDPTANAGAGDLRFFLFRFEQACNGTVNGCNLNDLLTPAVESNITSYSLYQDVDVQNTIFDCLQCHQPAGVGTPNILRMQELQNPWGHFFRNNRSNGQQMLAAFTAAHGTTETYAGIPGAVINNPANNNNNGAGPFTGEGPDPAALEGLVENQGFQKQPNEFDTGTLLNNGESAGWETLYQNAENGLDIPPPYHENLPTDPTLLASATTAYKTAMTNSSPLTTDIRDIFLATALPDLTFAPNATFLTSSDGTALLTQMCHQCHNPSLDQTLTRARFDVTKLTTMPAAELQKAIVRLNLPADSFQKMPPTRFRALSPAEITLATQVLNQ